MANPLRVLLATSWGQPQCGIQAHSEALIPAVRQANPGIEIIPSAEALDPDVVFRMAPTPDIIHLNYHRALHSRWTIEYVRRARSFWGCAVVITFHDTFGENPPDPLSQYLHDEADAFIVHEPVLDLPKAIYWRQAVPELDPMVHSMIDNTGMWGRPFVGSVGFDFGWKNYDRLCEIAAAVGWGVLLFVPEMSPEREADLRTRNRWLQVRRNEPLSSVLAGLHACAATAFLYVNGNSGTSAAIRIGIGARKPVIAMQTCRQFRDLRSEDAIDWVETFEEAQERLTIMDCTQWDPGIVALAEQDSWRHAGKQYAYLYRSVVEG